MLRLNKITYYRYSKYYLNGGLNSYGPKITLNQIHKWIVPVLITYEYLPKYDTLT